MSDSPWAVEPQPGWKLLRLKHVCRFVGGGTPDTGTAEYWQGDIPWVSPKDMKTSRIRDAEDHISDEGLNASATRLVGIGAVLIVMRSGILRHSIPVAVNEVPVALNQDMKALLTDSRLLPEYLARLVEGHQKELLKAWRKEGATVESLESDLLGNTLVPIPPAEVQQAIADYLDRETARLDALIAAKERLLGLLAEKRQALITRAVTRGLDPNVPLRDSGIPWLGPIPAHWKIRRAKWLFFERDERTLDGEGALLSLRMEVGLVPHNDVSEKIMRQEDVIGYKRTSPREIVVNRMRAAIGLIAVTPEEGLVSPDYAVFQCQPSANPEYFTHLFKTSLMQSAFRSESKGLGTGSSGFLRLYSEDFLSFWLPAPPFSEQLSIVQSVQRECEKLDGLRTCAERTIALSKERRSALIAAAVTGRIAIPSESIP